MTPCQSVVRDVLKRFPNYPKLTLAKKIYKENPQLFKDVEDARDKIRYWAGQHGDTNRSKLSTNDFLSGPGDYNPFDSLPDGLKHFGEWEPYVIHGENILVIADVHAPFHDKTALSIALNYGLYRGVDSILILGDYFDFYSGSKFQPDPRLVDFDKEIRVGYDILSIIRDKFPRSEIHAKLGNHDEHLERYLKVKAPELLNIKVLQIESIFNRGTDPGNKDLGISVVSDKRIVTIGGLSCVHAHEFGRSISSPVSPAKGLYNRGKETAMGAHHHQTSEHSEKSMTGDVAVCWSIGCLCHASDTYVLTSEGFKTFDDITIDDSIAEYDAITGNIFYKKPKQIHATKYSGEMYLFESQRLNQMVTPEHKMLIYRPDSVWKKKNESAGDLFNRRGLISTFISGDFVGDDKLIYGDQRDGHLAELIGFIITDGSYRERCDSIRIYQKHYYERVLELLDLLGVKYTIGMSRTVPVFNISAVFGKIVKEINPKKNNISRRLLNMSSNLLNRLYCGLINGDGTRKINRKYNTTTDSFSTHSIETSEQFQELCHKIGYSCVIKKIVRQKTNLCNRGNYIYTCFVRKRSTVNISHKSIVNYSGHVYDLTTESGYFVVRREGIISISGNCDLHPDYLPINKWNHGFAIVERDGEEFHVSNKKIIDGRVY